MESAFEHWITARFDCSMCPMKNARTYLCSSLALITLACGGGQSFDDGRDGVGRSRPVSKQSDAGPTGPSASEDASDAGVADDADAEESDAGPGDGGASSDQTRGGPNGGSSSPSANDSSPSAGGGANGSSINPNAPQFDCSEVRTQQFESTTMQAYSVSSDVSDMAEATLQSMGPSQMATQLMGVDGSSRDYRDIMRSPDVDVAGVGAIRGLRYRHGGRGVNLDAGQDNRSDDGNNFSTVFPTESLRAASWDLDLERRIGEAMGDETAASKNNVLLAPSVNLVRHPFWGRAQESYGEDPYLTGRMATAFAVGAQRYVIACAKAFAVYGIEKSRSVQNAIVSEQALREVYTRQVEMVVQDGGVGCVMAGYNLVNDVKMTQNQHLLRDILKAPVAQGGMGFEGFVVSELWAMPGDQTEPDAATAQAVTNEALLAGTDVERPWTLHYDTDTLANADPSLVEDAAKRVLTQKYRFNSALDSDPWSLEPPTSTLADGSIAPNEDHEALAEQSALESAVLLTNGLDPSSPVLPLTDAATIAVVGPDQDFDLVSSSVPKSCLAGEAGSSARACTFHFATDPALGDRGSSLVNGDPERSVGPFEGIAQVAGADRTVSSGNSAEAAQDADAVVVVVGYTPGDEGEEYTIASGGDRASLSLPPGQDDFVESVLDLDKPTIIVVESGSIVNLPWLSHPNRNQATIWTGYSGLRGGVALGKLIFGEANFSGKMPLAWPAEAELPPFREADTATTRDYFFGYREFDRRQYVDGTPVNLVFPFGHGLSYSAFEYANLSVPCETVTKDAIVDVTIDVSNTSSVDGDEVAMLFVKPPPPPPGSTGERPFKQLGSFARVSVPAGQTVTAHLPLRVRDLRRWEGNEDGTWVIDSGDYAIVVGKDAEDAESSPNVATISVSGD